MSPALPEQGSGAVREHSWSGAWGQNLGSATLDLGTEGKSFPVCNPSPYHAHCGALSGPRVSAVFPDELQNRAWGTDVQNRDSWSASPRCCSARFDQETDKSGPAVYQQRGGGSTAPICLTPCRGRKTLSSSRQRDGQHPADAGPLVSPSYLGSEGGTKQSSFSFNQVF